MEEDIKIILQDFDLEVMIIIIFKTIKIISNKYSNNTIFDGVIIPPRHCTYPFFRFLKNFILRKPLHPSFLELQIII